MPAENLDNLIRTLSHQLKSPVNAIESMLNVILDGFAGDVDSKTAHFLRKAVAKTREARALITDLLRYEQYGEGHDVPFEEIECTGFVADLAAGFQAAAVEKNVTLAVSVPDDKRITLKGSKAGLESAIRNVIDNAVKYTADGGTVSVSLTLNETEKRCLVTVADTGCGIPGEDLDRIFTPFFRSPSSKGSVDGSGLGLAIVKRVADRHGGSVAVASARDKGTTVTLTLPYASLHAAAVEGEPRKRIVIVGGVTAGPKAAARLRRLDERADITIIEKSALLSYAGCGIPSYVRGSVKSPRALMSTADNTLRDVHFFETIKNIRTFNRTEATAIDRSKKELHLRDLAKGTVRKIPYDVLVLATGAESLVPPIPGIGAAGVYSLYKIEDAEAIKNTFAQKGASDVCILGGGLVGIETAESLLMAGGRVTVIEKDERILKIFDRDIAGRIQQAIQARGIKVVTGATTREVRARDGRHIIITDRGEFHADQIILSAGVRPNSALARDAGLAIGEDGGIKVNDYLQTSDETIYAIGDCAESRHLVTGSDTYLPLGSISTKMGRIAADNICGRKTRFPGSIGTAMFKIFDLQVARTGLGTEQARTAGFDVETVVVAGLDKAHYEPDANPLIIKAAADRKTQRLLGAQGYGRGAVAKHIALLAAAVTRGLTLNEVFSLDLGYYPAFNNPIDISQTACCVLQNKIEGIVETIAADGFDRMADGARIIDLSPLQEHEAGAIPDSICVPLENLRQEGIPFEKNDSVVLYSKTSSRAYEAYRFLRANGFTGVKVLEGGYLFWKK